MKFVSIPYNDFIYEIFIYEMLCEIFVIFVHGTKVAEGRWNKENMTGQIFVQLLKYLRPYSLLHGV
jgi:hypothetical protein